MFIFLNFLYVYNIIIYNKIVIAYVNKNSKSDKRYLIKQTTTKQMAGMKRVRMFCQTIFTAIQLAISKEYNERSERQES